MAILANRVKIKNNLIELSKFTIFSIRRFFTFILLLITCYLLYFSSPYIARSLLEVSGRVLSAGSLIIQGVAQTSQKISGRLAYFKNLEAENMHLKLELASLEVIKQQKAEESLENIGLKKLLNVAKEIKRNLVTAKIIGASLTPFASFITIQAGQNDGINENDIVRGKVGLIGRVTEVSDNYSTVMLVNDHNSRIPVVTGDSKSRGILARQGDQLKVIYLQENHSVQEGEKVYTSGDGRIYPKGIEVAIITGIEGDEVIADNVENISDLDFVVVESRVRDL